MGETLFFISCESAPVLLGETQFTSNDFAIIDDFDAVNREIDNLLELKENWDGQGAIPVLGEVAETAKKLVAIVGFVDCISDIFPNPQGSLTIEWTNRTKEKLSLEVGANSYSYFVKYLENNPKFVDGNDILADTEMLTQDLGELFSEEILNFIQ